MYRILLADDEGIMLESLKMILESNFKNECELAFAKTGRAVIEQVKIFHPDIVFMDIQMPGINGIQAMKEIRKTNKNIIFIIITAYDQFSYAKEAVDLGALEYLTKPVNRKVIIDVTIKAMKQIEEERKRLSDGLKIREKLEIVVPIIESGFIYNILLQDDFFFYQGNYKELLNIVQDYGFIIVTEFGDSVENGMMTNAVGASVRASRFYKEYREIVKAFFDCIIGPVMGNRIVLFVPYETKSIPYEERVFFITKARNLVHTLEEKIDSKFRVGIGQVYSMEELKESYQEAIGALKRGEGSVVHIKDVSVEQEQEERYPEELEREYIQLAIRGELTGAISIVNEIFDWILKHYYEYREDIEIKVLELVIILEQRAVSRGGIKYGFRHRENYIRDIQNCLNYGELRDWLLNKTKEVCSNLVTIKEKESTSVVEKAKKYIDKNFYKDISLDDVSRQVDISPYYFSKLFKQKEGETFIEYLTNARISHAKELLLNPEYSIKEICVLSGYSDPNYFSRIFKKYEEVTPSEYREKVGIK